MGSCLWETKAVGAVTGTDAERRPRKKIDDESGPVIGSIEGLVTMEGEKVGGWSG